MIDTETLKAKSDLLALAQRDTALRRVASTGGGEFAGPCPFCGGADRFRVEPNADGGGRWLCRNCTEGKWQDAIAYVMRRESCDFRQACDLLGAGDTLPTRPHPAAPTLRPTEPPPAEWQAAARLVVETCERNLWADVGQRARAYLAGRGLSDDTLRRWHLGYLPGGAQEWRNVAGPSVPCGILIPCEIAGAIWYLKVRRAVGELKYIQVKGSVPALFGADTLRGHDVAVMCEGEFDAMLLAQEAGDLCGVGTLGSASGNLDLGAWGAYLLPVARLLIAYDLDGAGDKGAGKLAGLTARARRVSVPAMPNVKDITDFWKAGGKLRAWLAFEIARLAAPTPKTSAQPAEPQDIGAECAAIYDAWRADLAPNDAIWARRYADAAIRAVLPFYSGGIGIVETRGDGVTVTKPADVPYPDGPRDLGAWGWDCWAETVGKHQPELAKLGGAICNC